MNALSGALSDRPLAQATAIPETDTVGQARTHAAGRWIIPINADGAPLAAVAPGTLDYQPANRPLATLIHDLPPAVIADAATPLRAFLGSWLIDEIDTGSAVVLVARGAVYGVWAAPDLDRLLAHATGPGATYSDTELPGDIMIPLLTKGCQFQQGGTPCPAVRQFPERPSTPPPCDNPAGLSAHQFRW